MNTLKPGNHLYVLKHNGLSGLSLEGEKLVDQEVSKALYGIKQMKEVMARNEEKHTNLMNSLRHSGEKKKVSEHSSAIFFFFFSTSFSTGVELKKIQTYQN